MKSDHLSSPNQHSRIPQAIALLAASAALYACSSNTGGHETAVDDATISITEPMYFDSLNNLELEYKNYFESPDRAAKLHEEVGLLAEEAARISRESDRFETVAYRNETGQFQVDMTGENAQGDMMHISFLGGEVDTPIVFDTADGEVSISPDSVFMTVVPHGAPEDFYNFDNDVRISVDESGHYYDTALRVEADGRGKDFGVDGRYYYVNKDEVGVALINHQDPESSKGGDSRDPKTGQLVDKYVYERGRQLLLSIDNEGPVSNYYYADIIAYELQPKVEVGTESTTPVGSPVEQNEEPMPQNAPSSVGGHSSSEVETVSDGSTPGIVTVPTPGATPTTIED